MIRDKRCKTKSVRDIAIAFYAINLKLKYKQIWKKVSKNFEIVKNTHLRKSSQTLSVEIILTNHRHPHKFKSTWKILDQSGPSSYFC